MGDSGEGGDEDVDNGAGAGDAIKDSRVVGVIIWDQELGGDGGNYKSTGGITSSGSKKDYRDDGAAYN